jgi:hypothetical protein
MASADAWASGAVKFVETASRQRAASYRERAAHLTVMADAEPIGKLRAQLSALARQHEELADSLDAPNAAHVPT